MVFDFSFQFFTFESPLILLGMSDIVGNICIYNPEDKQSQDVAPVYGDPVAIESEVFSLSLKNPEIEARTI